MFKSILSEILPKLAALNVNRSFLVIQNSTKLGTPLLPTAASAAGTKRCFSVTSSHKNLMEFFDDEKNWGEPSVKHGREWKLDELRLKSSLDLHKLWFVLLKERNMLLTMEDAYKKEYESMPNPERIAKVDLSMENLLQVVRERDVSYNLLETGETKERRARYKFNSIGYLQEYTPKEYYLPWYMNRTWKLKYHYKQLPAWSKWYRNQLAVREDRQSRRKLKKVKENVERLKLLYPEYADHEEFWSEYLEEKMKIEKKVPYSEKLNKPAADELPDIFKEKPKPKVQLYEEEF